MGSIFEKVYICSPYRGKTGQMAEVTRNVHMAQEYCRKIVKKRPNTIPVAPHIYFTQFMDDRDPLQRVEGMAMGRALLEECKAVLVFDEVTEGMRAELIAAEQMGIPVYNGYAAIECNLFIKMEKEFWEQEVGVPAPGTESRKSPAVTSFKSYCL